MVWKSNCLKMKFSLIQIFYLVSTIGLVLLLFLSGYWGWSIFILLIFIFQIIFKLKSVVTQSFESILEICPHCKNPNTNRSTTCEWCGNQII